MILLLEFVVYQLIGAPAVYNCLFYQYAGHSQGLLLFALEHVSLSELLKARPVTTGMLYSLFWLLLPVGCVQCLEAWEEAIPKIQRTDYDVDEATQLSPKTPPHTVAGNQT